MKVFMVSLVLAALVIWSMGNIIEIAEESIKASLKTGRTYEHNDN